MKFNETIFLEGFKDGIKPDAILSVSEWAEQYRMLSTKASAEPGPWRNKRTPYLVEIMDCMSTHSPITEVTFSKGSQVGAPLALDTLVPTPEGFKAINDIAAGDTVFDEKGKQQKVLGTSKVFTGERCYEVTFSCGTIVKCDWRHLWTLEHDNFKGKYKSVTLATEEISETYKVRERNRYRLKTTDPLELSEKKLPIGPYTLGVWLGDGNCHMNRITTHQGDAVDIAKRIRGEGYRAKVVRLDPSRGLASEIVIDPVRGERFCKRGHDTAAEKGKTKTGRCARCAADRSYYQQYGKRKPVEVEPRFGELLSSTNLKRNKHIPPIYLQASYDQRLELLRGLMDTDGYCAKKGLCEFYTVHEDFGKDVLALVNGLGIKAGFIVKKHKERESRGRVKSSSDIYVVRFRAYDSVRVFSLKRKYERQVSEKNGRPAETNYRRIKKVEEVPSFPTKCIAVSSENNLFLIGREMIPTHNTEMGVNWIGYAIQMAPGPMMMVQPSIDMLKRVSRQRLNPLIEECAELKRLVASASSRSSGNTLFEKEFRGGILVMATSNSPSGLRSMPAGKLFLDEIDAYPLDVDGEGSPVELAKARTRTFAKRKKILKVSTPTIKGLSVIESEFLESDQRYYHVPCPHCKEYQKLEFKQLKWEKGDYQSVRYYCVHCGEGAEEFHKTKMLEKGKWIAENPGTNPKKRSYHLSSLYSPYGMFSWAEIAEDWEKAQANEPKLIAFINTVLGETWEIKGDAPKWRRLYERREKYKKATVPVGACVLTMGVDVQKDRLEAHIMGWGPNGQKWSIDYLVIPGDTSDLNVDGPWNKLAEAISKEYPHEISGQLPLKMVAIDSGYNTSTVYEFVRKYPPNRVIAVKGRDSMAQVVGTPTKAEVRASGKKIKKGVASWPVGVSIIKSEIYGWLKIDKPTDEELEQSGWPVNFFHIPEMSEEFFKQLTAEQLVKRKNKKSGYTSHVWEKKHERNEVLDTVVYNRAAAALIGIDRFDEEKWRKMAMNLGVSPIKIPESATIHGDIPASTAKKKRKIRRKTIDNGIN